jgi:hypothetical protein
VVRRVPRGMPFQLGTTFLPFLKIGRVSFESEYSLYSKKHVRSLNVLVVLDIVLETITLVKVTMPLESIWNRIISLDLAI